MIIKGIIDEDFINYKLPSMVIEMPFCSFKCDKECGEKICQNSALIKVPNINIHPITLIQRYLNNPITKAIVFQGLEPLDSYMEVWDFITTLRQDFNCKDTVVIYTGYNENEEYLTKKCFEVGQQKLNIIEHLAKKGNIIIKFGRFIPNQPHKFDEVLGVELASNNQYAKRI